MRLGQRKKVLGDIFTNRFSLIEGREFKAKIEMEMEEGKLSDIESKNRRGYIVKIVIQSLGKPLVLPVRLEKV